MVQSTKFFYLSILKVQLNVQLNFLFNYFESAVKFSTKTWAIKYYFKSADFKYPQFENSYFFLFFPF